MQKDIASNAADTLARNTDDLIARAIQDYLGVELLDLDSLAGRCEAVTREGVDGQTFCVDGEPILWLGEPTFSQEGALMTLNCQYRGIPQSEQAIRNWK